MRKKIWEEQRLWGKALLLELTWEVALTGILSGISRNFKNTEDKKRWHGANVPWDENVGG